MFIEVEDNDGVKVVKIEGEIRTEDARKLGETFETLLEDGDLDLVLDLDGVSYVTSAGLGHIVSVAAVLRRRGGNLGVAGLKGDVRKAFEVTRIDRVVEVCPNVSSAVDTLRRMRT